MGDLTIWKFPLEIVDEMAIEMPVGARLLTVQVQGGTPTLWALVSPQAPKVQRRIRIIGTGHPLRLADDLSYVGTVQTIGAYGGDLVWHVFDGGTA